MDFYQMAKARFSVRQFDGRRVKKNRLNAILEAGRIAPTAKNSQPQVIYVLESDEAIEKINSASPCIYGSKTVLLICYDKNRVCKNPNDSNGNFGQIDCSIVMTHILLEAQNQGVNSCIVGYFDANKIRESFNLPDNIVPVLLLPLGYAKEGTVPSEYHSSILEENLTIVKL